MRILYVTLLWPGFRECLFDGELEPNGLPSFNKPLMKLIEKGHKVDFVILNSAYNPENRKTNIQAGWLKKSYIWEIVPTDLRPHKKILTYIRLIIAVKRAISLDKYDFIYAHGSTTAVVRPLAKMYKIPFGQRLYGTFLWSKMQQWGKLYVSIRHITEYRSFITPKSFLLVTNDGSRGDLVYKEIWRKKVSPFEFCYWINGVDPASDITDEMIREFSQGLVEKPFIFYVGRFDSWKRQDRAIRIIAELKKRGLDIHLYLAGPQNTVGIQYFDTVMDLVRELAVEDRVTYMGNVDAKTINIMCKLSLASLSLYDVCNLTNVFHEMLAAGAVVIVQKDGTTDGYIEHGVNGFFVTSDAEAVNIIERIINNPKATDGIRKHARMTSLNKMKTWDQRSEDEIRLIEKYVKVEELQDGKKT